MKTLALFTRGLRTKETQEEILASLLDNAVNCFPRVALFAVRGGILKGWSSRGFSDSTAGTISSYEFRQDDDSWLMETLKNGKQEKIAKLPDTGLLRLMGNDSQGAWWIYPLYVLGRPVAVLLAGEAGDSAGRPESLAVFMDCAALRLENVALKIIKTLSDASHASADKPSFNAPSDHQPMTAVSPYVLSLDLTAPINIPEPAEPGGGESYYKPDGFRPNPLAGLKLADKPPEPAVGIPVTETLKNGQESVVALPKTGASEHKQENVVESMPDATRAAAEDLPPPPATEDERLHAAAKRFAELLVVGIKFYNEHAIVEGRENRDLYKRIQTSINRNREMYERRVAPTVAEKIDYLHEEFVSILANGDAGVFGEGYPGPIIGGPDRMKKN